MVLVLVLLPALAPSLGGQVPEGAGAGRPMALTIAITLAQVAAFVAFMLLVGPLGALADRVGRRPIYVAGFLWIGTALVVITDGTHPARTHDRIGLTIPGEAAHLFAPTGEALPRTLDPDTERLLQI